MGQASAGEDPDEKEDHGGRHVPREQVLEDRPAPEGIERESHDDEGGGRQAREAAVKSQALREEVPLGGGARPGGDGRLGADGPGGLDPGDRGARLLGPVGREPVGRE